MRILLKNGLHLSPILYYTHYNTSFMSKTTPQPPKQRIRKAKNLYLDPKLVDATEKVLAEEAKELGKEKPDSLSVHVEGMIIEKLKAAGKLPAGY